MPHGGGELLHCYRLGVMVRITGHRAATPTATMRVRPSPSPVLICGPVRHRAAIVQFRASNLGLEEWVSIRVFSSSSNHAQGVVISFLPVSVWSAQRAAFYRDRSRRCQIINTVVPFQRNGQVRLLFARVTTGLTAAGPAEISIRMLGPSSSQRLSCPMVPFLHPAVPGIPVALNRTASAQFGAVRSHGGQPIERSDAPCNLPRRAPAHSDRLH